MTDLGNLMNLRGRKALITGAAGSLGNVFSETLAELGADLILVDMPDKDLDILSRGLVEKFDIKVSVYYCDLEKEEKRLELANNVLSHDQLNILVNNAAFVGSNNIDGWSVDFERQSIDTWRRAMEVNLTAPFHLSQLLYPALFKATNANIINIASIYGEYGPDWSLYDDTQMANPAAYSASKGGIIQLTRWLATTLSPSIRVNAISPGGIERSQPDNFQSRYARRTPMGRMANEDDFRGVIAYLASDMSCYVTGQILSIDGGWGVW